MAYLRSAASRLAAPIVARAERPADLGRYAGATRGEVIGEVAGADAGRVRLALGGVRKLWGFLDLSARRELVVAADQLVFGPSRTVAWSYVAYTGPHTVATAE